jgi:hypothetical protein
LHVDDAVLTAIENMENMNGVSFEGECGRQRWELKMVE